MFNKHWLEWHGALYVNHLVRETCRYVLSYFTFYERESCNLKRLGFWPKTRGQKPGHQPAQTSDCSLPVILVSYFSHCSIKISDKHKPMKEGVTLAYSYMDCRLSGGGGHSIGKKEEGSGATVVHFWQRSHQSEPSQSTVKGKEFDYTVSKTLPGCTGLWFQLVLFSLNFIHV